MRVGAVTVVDANEDAPTWAAATAAAAVLPKAFDNAFVNNEFDIRVLVELVDDPPAVLVDGIVVVDAAADPSPPSFAMWANEFGDDVPANINAVASWPRLMRRISAKLGDAAAGDSPSDADDSSDMVSSPSIDSSVGNDDRAAVFWTAFIVLTTNGAEMISNG